MIQALSELLNVGRERRVDYVGSETLIGGLRAIYLLTERCPSTMINGS